MIDVDHALKDFYELREKRLALQHEVDRLEQLEKDILYDLTKDLNPENKYSGQHGGYIFKANPKVIPTVTKWEDVLAYIRAEHALDLLQRRLTESAVKTRWDNGIIVPGIDKTTKWSVTVTKGIES